MTKVETRQKDTREDLVSFDGLSRSYHDEMIKLHDRVRNLTGASGKRDSKTLAVLGFLLSVLSLCITGYNAYLNRDTQKKQILDTISELSKLTPPPLPIPGKPTTVAPASDAALSSDTNSYWLKIDQLVSEINLATKGTLAKRSYVTLIGTSLAFGDSKHARAFLQNSESSNDDDSDSQIQLALEWAQLAEATQDSTDVSAAISNISHRPSHTARNAVVEYQIHYDLADMYLLLGPSIKKETLDAEIAAATTALSAIDDPVAAERLKILNLDLSSRAAKRQLPTAPISVKAARG